MVLGFKMEKGVFESENRLFQDFNNVLQAIQVIKHVADSWFWRPISSSDHTTNSTYVLSVQAIGEDNNNDLISQTWSIIIPNNVTFLI